METPRRRADVLAEHVVHDVDRRERDMDPTRKLRGHVGLDRRRQELVVSIEEQDVETRRFSKPRKLAIVWPAFSSSFTGMVAGVAAQISSMIEQLSSVDLSSTMISSMFG